MTQGKLTNEAIQQQVLTFIETGKNPKWIMKRLSLPKSSFYDIAKRGQIKSKNQYKIRPGQKKE